MIARRLLYTGSDAMMTSALLGMSAVIVAPFAEKLVGPANEGLASGAVAGVAAGTAPASGALPRNSGGACDSVDPEAGPPVSPPDSIARSVCATRAASAFLRYTMNM